MRIVRRFTESGRDAYASLAFTTTNSEIRNPDGSVVFQARDIEVPAAWSQVACDVLAQKYFRKRGLPAALRPVAEPDVPGWLWRREADEAAIAALPEGERQRGENSAKQVFDRLAGTWTYWGWKGGYFDTEEDARACFSDPDALDGLCRFAFLGNLTGLPAATAPVGLDPAGLPIGLQIIGDAWDEATVLAVLAHLERTEIASVRRPPGAVDLIGI